MFLDSRKWLKHSSKWGTQTQPRESERQLRTCNEVLVSICLKGRQSPLLLHTWAVNPPCDIWVSLKPLCFDLIHTDIYKSRPKASACAICRYVILWSKVANSAASALFPPMARASLYAMHIQIKFRTHTAQYCTDMIERVFEYHVVRHFQQASLSCLWRWKDTAQLSAVRWFSASTRNVGNLQGIEMHWKYWNFCSVLCVATRPKDPKGFQYGDQMLIIVLAEGWSRTAPGNGFKMLQRSHRATRGQSELRMDPSDGCSSSSGAQSRSKMSSKPQTLNDETLWNQDAFPIKKMGKGGN